MPWEVEFTDEFEAWWNSLNEAEQIEVNASVKLLMDLGPSLKYPHSTSIESSRYSRMRELRTQCHGRPLRTLYAFDPRRVAILLIGGDKTGDDRWYQEFVPVADKIFAEHLKQLEKGGTGNG